MIFLIIVLVLIIVIAAMSFICEHSIYHPIRNDKEHEFETLPTWGHDIKPFYEKTAHNPFSIDVPNGYTLYGEIIPADSSKSFDDGRQRVVILVHGRTANRYTVLSHGEAYHKLGFNLVVYDQRAHGVSGGDTCSMGYYESQDLVYLANEVRKMFPEDSVWGIHGESMGAATVMMAAPDLPWLSFVAEDCGYATLRQEIDDSIRFKTKLPAFPLGNLTAFISDKKEAYKLSDVQPIESVKKITAPMIFIHGGQDKFVPTENVYKLYDAKPDSEKMRYVFDDVPHAKSALMHNNEYGKLLEKFLKIFNLI